MKHTDFYRKYREIEAQEREELKKSRARSWWRISFSDRKRRRH